MTVPSKPSSDGYTLRVELSSPVVLAGLQITGTSNKVWMRLHVLFCSLIAFSALKYYLFRRTFLKEQQGANGKSLRGNFSKNKNNQTKHKQTNTPNPSQNAKTNQTVSNKK